jgi:riboflavin kinase/FMN adenylyltransferase
VGPATSKGVTNIGVRPSFHDSSHRTVETHLLGYNDDLYGQTLQINLLRFLRPEKKFESPEALRAQIAKDVGMV